MNTCEKQPPATALASLWPKQPPHALQVKVSKLLKAINRETRKAMHHAKILMNAKCSSNSRLIEGELHEIFQYIDCLDS